MQRTCDCQALPAASYRISPLNTESPVRHCKEFTFTVKVNHKGIEILSQGHLARKLLSHDSHQGP